MKKLLFVVILLALGSGVFAQEIVPAQKTALGQMGPAVYMLPTAEQRAHFKQRNKQVRELAKKYRKAKSAEEKAALKEQLAHIVSQATDESMAWMHARIEAEKANLALQEAKLKEREKNLAQLKAQRVEDILSGAAERRFKLAKKRWKQEIKDLKKSMK